MDKSSMFISSAAVKSYNQNKFGEISPLSNLDMYFISFSYIYEKI